ncbi:MAG: hypothetical protein O2971_12440 [Proteobacteria bacterium]|nr:hypothetical protein [Pseudomonadota bacterium]
MSLDTAIEHFLETQIEAMVKAGIDPAKIYATAMTDGLMPTEDNLQQISKNDLQEWQDHHKRFEHCISNVKKLIKVAKKSPAFKPGDEPYIAGVYFAVLISGMAIGTELGDYPEEQQDTYMKAIWVFDRIYAGTDLFVAAAMH